DRGLGDHARRGDRATRSRATFRGASRPWGLWLPIRPDGRVRAGPGPLRFAARSLSAAAEGRLERARALPAGAAAGPSPARRGAPSRFPGISIPAKDARQCAGFARPARELGSRPRRHWEGPASSRRRVIARGLSRLGLRCRLSTPDCRPLLMTLEIIPLGGLGEFGRNLLWLRCE